MRDVSYFVKGLQTPMRAITMEWQYISKEISLGRWAKRN